MSYNYQLNPGSFKAVLLLTACLIVVFEVLK
jgi:hypothetical protein